MTRHRSGRALVESARTLLFVPGDRPDRFAKASSSADIAILDLEDAVASDNKQFARTAACDWLRAGGQAVVRVNAADTAWYEADVLALRDLPGVCGIMLPKVESAADCADAFQRAGGATPVIALVESACGIAELAAIASSAAVARLAFGSIDYALDIGAIESWDSMLFARSALVQASRVAGLVGPIDGVTTSIDDQDRIAADARRSRGLGFTAKLCIHPSQIPQVAAGFRPSTADVEWAREVLDAGVAGAGRVGGNMVDRPVRERAERILASLTGDDA